MTRLLLRSGKDPFRVLSPEETLATNALGTNAGNLIFSHAVHRTLSTPGTQIDSSRFVVDPAQADEINDSYDAFVVPLANAFRMSFRGHLERLTRLIQRLTIPAVVVGVGAQASREYDFSTLLGIEDAVRDFCAAVLDRSATIGVRGRPQSSTCGASASTPARSSAACRCSSTGTT
jgi:hypothetical protein